MRVDALVHLPRLLPAAVEHDDAARRCGPPLSVLGQLPRCCRPRRREENNSSLSRGLQLSPQAPVMVLDTPDEQLGAEEQQQLRCVGAAALVELRVMHQDGHAVPELDAGEACAATVLRQEPAISTPASRRLAEGQISLPSLLSTAFEVPTLAALTPLLLAKALGAVADVGALVSAPHDAGIYRGAAASRIVTAICRAVTANATTAASKAHGAQAAQGGGSAAPSLKNAA
mmetsp:Transcript_116509/g.260600  ORF Transcript_116509/g.260600 Transcript_116509/m.260600 type:complete len:230 (+) Transcript_116509:338-1027(+)